ncbi:lipid phosphate phosphatase gamma-like isoform X4 [Musa acuminata AAA Group]|uniref:lipid phosphate phosphatase gamma-like isoform X4 n=1 Tax=Musa acuminata AAA Group TaxID=214697 RepID=UPI0031DF1130
MEDAPAAALKAVTLTHVRYPRGDSLGHFLAWVSLIPVFISFGGFISHFIFRRELQGLCFALGLIISQVINELIKSSIHQSRPSSMCAVLEVCDSHGWPSSHSQFMFFFSTYFSLLCLINGVGVSSPSSRRIIALLPWPSAFLTLYSRVYLGYHTVPQWRRARSGDSCTSRTRRTSRTCSSSSTTMQGLPGRNQPTIERTPVYLLEKD